MDWSILLTGAFGLQVLAASIQSGAPVILAAQGEILAERAGVLNLGVEGVMLVAGLAGFGVAYATGSLALGIAGAVVAGMVLGLLFAFVTVTLRADQIVAGLAILIFCTGIAYYANRLLFGASLIVPRLAPLPPVPIPFLSAIPVIGPALFRQDVLVYAMLVLTAISMVVLFRTPFGLRLNAVGEFPAAADVVGVSVLGVRYVAVVVAGGLAGLAGAYLSLAVLGLYSDSMVGGRGFMALALVVFGRWHPAWALAGGLLFGAVDAVQTRLQFLGAPVAPQFLIMLPYLLTILVLLVGRRRAAPAALTVPYTRE